MTIISPRGVAERTSGLGRVVGGQSTRVLVAASNHTYLVYQSKVLMTLSTYKYVCVLPGNMPLWVS